MWGCVKISANELGKIGDFHNPAAFIADEGIYLVDALQELLFKLILSPLSCPGASGVLAEISGCLFTRVLLIEWFNTFAPASPNLITMTVRKRESADVSWAAIFPVLRVSSAHSLN